MKELLEAIERRDEARRLDVVPLIMKDLEFAVGWYGAIVRRRAINWAFGYPVKQ